MLFKCHSSLAEAVESSAEPVEEYIKGFVGCPKDIIVDPSDLEGEQMKGFGGNWMASKLPSSISIALLIGGLYDGSV